MPKPVVKKPCVNESDADFERGDGTGSSGCAGYKNGTGLGDLYGDRFGGGSSAFPGTGEGVGCLSGGGDAKGLGSGEGCGTGGFSFLYSFSVHGDDNLLGLFYSKASFLGDLPQKRKRLSVNNGQVLMEWIALVKELGLHATVVFSTTQRISDEIHI